MKRVFLALGIWVGQMVSGHAQVSEPDNQVQTYYSNPYYVVGSYLVSWGYFAINLSAATNAGYTGKGVTVAVFDTGLNVNSPKFTGNLVTGWNLYGNGGLGSVGVTGDNQWHGTFVSSIVAANTTVMPNTYNMYGVAPQARIMPIQILDKNGAGSWTDAQLAKAINYATNMGAKIFNNSWNTNTTQAELTTGQLATVKLNWSQEILAYQQAAKKNVLITFAAGNYGKTDPGLYATLPSFVTGLSNNWIAVVATDQTGAIASYSNRCGLAAAYCMAAPGSSILGLYGNTVGAGSGTSFATPIVAGAAALMEQKWPALTGYQIQQILFTTADKSGIYANKSIYGQGMLNLTQAFAPVGTTTVATTSTVNGSSTPLNGTYVSSGGAVGAALAGNLAGTNLMILDSFKRDYQVDLGNGVAKFGSLIGWRDRISAFNADEYRTGESAIWSGSGSSFTEVKLPAGMSVSIGANTSASLAYGPFASRGIRGSDLVLMSSVGNPFMNMSPNGLSVAMGTQWNSKDTTKVGVFTNTVALDDRTKTIGYSAPKVSGAVIDHTHTWDSAWINANIGFVGESNSVLGTYSGGSLSLGQGANTTFVGLSAGFKMDRGWQAFAGANAGYTNILSSDTSLVKDIRNLTSGNAYVGVSKVGVFGDADRTGLVFGLPMRTLSGTADLRIPTSRDVTGNVYFTEHHVGLGNQSREWSTQAFYNTAIGNNQTMGIGVGARFNASDLEAGQTETIGMARYKLRF